VPSVKIQAEIASKPAQSKRKPVTIDKESSDEIEETEAKPSRATSVADTRSGKADLSTPSFLFEAAN
jgi:hypothetical protein